MTVAGDCERVGKSISFFDDDLVSYTPTCGIEIDAMFPAKLFDFEVFCEVLFRLVLYVMVKCKYKLLGIGDLGSANGLEPGMQLVTRAMQTGWADLDMTGPVLSWVMTCAG